MEPYFLFIVLLLPFAPCVLSQLVVNVKNNGGDVYRENINANTTQDSICLEFRKADGTLVTQLIDGKNEIQIFKTVILPEEERGQTQIQTMCFISRFTKNEFISSDAMSKLRQKNPSAIRHPEESRPEEFIQMDVLVNVAAAAILSPHITTLCSNATDSTYMSESELRLLAQILNRDHQSLLNIVHSAPVDNTNSCQMVQELSQPCTCHYDVCVGWYPCGLKYCRGKDSANRVVSYRCGIKTCSKCRSFEFLVKMKSQCIWDEPEFSFEGEIGHRTALTETVPLSSSAQPVLAKQEHEPENNANAQVMEKAGVDNVQNIVKMKQKGVADDSKKIPPPPPAAGSSNRVNNVGKNSQLDDDEDGE